MPETLNEQIADARATRDQLWKQLDELEAALAPKLAAFLLQVGFVRVTPFLCDCEGHQRSMELVWSFPSETGGKPEEVEQEFHGGDFLSSLLNEPERFADCVETDGLVEEVKEAAQAQGLDLAQVIEFIDEHALMITLDDGQVQLGEVVTPR